MTVSQPSAAEWQSYLHREIPITAALGVRVSRLDAGGIELAAPLAANHNDKGTGFAGSLFAVAVLSGWSQVMLLLRDAGLPGEAVIAASQVRFLRPARADFRARCLPPSTAAVETFCQQLRKRRRARLTLTIEVMAGTDTVLELEGQYAAIAK